MTYYQWIEYFDKLKTMPISDEPINMINNSNIDYQGNMKVRYLKVINYRLNNSLDNFLLKSKTINQNKDSIAIELNDLKKEIVFAKKLASVKHFDDNVKEQLLTNIKAFGNEMNQSIRNSYANCNNNEILMIVQNIDFNA